MCRINDNGSNDPSSNSSDISSVYPGYGGGNGGSNDGGDDPSDDSSSSEDSSSDDSSDEEEDFYLSTSRLKNLDGSKNPIPSLPAGQKAARLFRLKLKTDLDGINASAIVAPDGKRIKRPKWKRHKAKSGKKYRSYKKKRKAYYEANRTILFYLRNTALSTNHNLKTQLGRITSGVEAHDYIMKEIDPVSYDIMASSADAISTYNDPKLTSTSLMIVVGFVICDNGLNSMVILSFVSFAGAGDGGSASLFVSYSVCFGDVVASSSLPVMFRCPDLYMSLGKGGWRHHGQFSVLFRWERLPRLFLYIG